MEAGHLGTTILGILLKILLFIVQGYIVFRVIKCLQILTLSIYYRLFKRPIDLTPFKSKWTVITGCTDGIGEAYTDELAASRGLRKFLLIARNPQKLDRVADRLRKQFNCEVRTFVHDFESTEHRKLSNELAEIDADIGILINCAGIAAERVANFAELPEGLSSKILQVNLMSTVKMIELVLPGMLKRNKGIVVNFSSILGWRPYPYLSTYPASKAGISFLTAGLSEEFEHTNVRIQCMMPCLVATKIASYETSEANNIFVVKPQSYARQAVRMIGLAPLATGCIQHDLQIGIGQLIGHSLFKLFFVPLGILRIHRKRVDNYQAKKLNGKDNEAKSVLK